MQTRLRSLIRRGLPWLVGLLLGIFLVDQWVWYSTAAQRYSAVSDIPHRKVGLLLGTSKWLKGHRINNYYIHRISAAVELFRAGKIDYVLVSGDNRKEAYNEPEMMRRDLLRAGVPANRIISDYAGLRTLDSILRCRDVFGERQITIISQPFHNARALFIANRKSMDAIAYNAADTHPQHWIWAFGREKLARVKVVLDLMFGKEAKFYGAPIQIG